MRNARRWIAPEDNETGENRQAASLGGLVLALILVVAGLFLIHVLRQQARIEDCLLAGRVTCDMAVLLGH
jgi:hypothetical protein